MYNRRESKPNQWQQQVELFWYATLTEHGLGVIGGIRASAAVIEKVLRAPGDTAVRSLEYLGDQTGLDQVAQQLGAPKPSDFVKAVCPPLF